MSMAERRASADQRALSDVTEAILYGDGVVSVEKGGSERTYLALALKAMPPERSERAPAVWSRVRPLAIIRAAEREAVLACGIARNGLPSWLLYSVVGDVVHPEGEFDDFDAAVRGAQQLTGEPPVQITLVELRKIVASQQILTVDVTP